MAMFKKLTSIWVALLVLTLLNDAQENRAVVLSETSARNLKQLCSRPSPKFDSTWSPAEADIREMEAHLSRISELQTRASIGGVRIKRPERYFRQYIGIVVGNRKLIYINAICDEKPPVTWHEALVSTCDGGCDWGVIYDTRTPKFSDLTVNGIG